MKIDSFPKFCSYRDNLLFNNCNIKTYQEFLEYYHEILQYIQQNKESLDGAALFETRKGHFENKYLHLLFVDRNKARKVKERIQDATDYLHYDLMCIEQKKAPE